MRSNAKQESIVFERDQCELLTLVLKKKWFDMIASGEKTAEYRTSKNVCAQIERWYGRARIKCSYEKGKASIDKHLIVKFCLGYGKDRPTFMRNVLGVEKRCWSLCPDWGEPREPHMVINLGDPVEFAS